MVVAACTSLCGAKLSDGTLASTYSVCELTSYTSELCLNLCAALLCMVAQGIAHKA